MERCAALGQCNFTAVPPITLRCMPLSRPASITRRTSSSMVTARVEISSVVATFSSSLYGFVHPVRRLLPLHQVQHLETEVGGGQLQGRSRDIQVLPTVPVEPHQEPAISLMNKGSLREIVPLPHA